MVKGIIKKEKGYALVNSIIILLVVSIFAAALINVTSTNHKLSIRDRNFQSVYYISEAGIRYHLRGIQEKVLSIYTPTISQDEFFNKINSHINGQVNGHIMGSGYFDVVKGDQPQAYIECQQISYNQEDGVAEYHLKSKATIGEGTRETEIKFSVYYPFRMDADYAVFAEEGMTFNPSTRIKGSIATNSTDPASVKFGADAKITGECYVLPSAPDDVVEVPHYETPPELIKELEMRENKMPRFPQYPKFNTLSPKTIGGNSYTLIDSSGNLKLDSGYWASSSYEYELANNAYIPKLIVSSGKTLILKTNKNIQLVIDELSVNASDIRFSGEGSITLFVKSKINIISDAVINRPNPGQTENETIERLTMYYSGTDRPIIGDDVRVYGSLYAETAKISIGGSGGFLGYILTGTTEPLEMSGASSSISRMIYAPNAPIILSGSTHITGAFVGKSMVAGGGVNIEFDPNMEFPENPFAPSNPTMDDLIPLITPIKEI